MKIDTLTALLLDPFLTVGEVQREHGALHPEESAAATPVDLPVGRGRTELAGERRRVEVDVRRPAAGSKFPVELARKRGMYS